MADESLGSISLFFQQLQQGDREAARPMWLRFFPRLAGLAHRILHNKRLPQSAEDAVQEAFFQFFRRVEKGDYPAGLHRDDLWRLLSTMTVQAARKLSIREGALKRGGGRVFSEADALGNRETSMDSLGTTLATQDWDLMCEELIEQLDENLREVAILRLGGYTNPQIKTMLQCSLRSVERRLQMIRVLWSDDVTR